VEKEKVLLKRILKKLLMNILPIMLRKIKFQKKDIQELKDMRKKNTQDL